MCEFWAMAALRVAA